MRTLYRGSKDGRPPPRGARTSAFPTLAYWNARGLVVKDKAIRDDKASYLLKLVQSADIVGVGESHITTFNWGWLVDFVSSHSLVLWCVPSDTPKGGFAFFAKEGWTSWFTYLAGSTTELGILTCPFYTISGAYPNGDIRSLRLDLYRDWGTLLAPFTDRPGVLMADWNHVRHPEDRLVLPLGGEGPAEHPPLKASERAEISAFDLHLGTPFGLVERSPQEYSFQHRNGRTASRNTRFFLLLSEDLLSVRAADYRKSLSEADTSLGPPVTYRQSDHTSSLLRPGAMPTANKIMHARRVPDWMAALPSFSIWIRDRYRRLLALKDLPLFTAEADGEVPEGAPTPGSWIEQEREPLALDPLRIEYHMELLHQAIWEAVDFYHHQLEAGQLIDRPVHIPPGFARLTATTLMSWFLGGSAHMDKVQGLLGKNPELRKFVDWHLVCSDLPLPQEHRGLLQKGETKIREGSPPSDSAAETEEESQDPIPRPSYSFASRPPGYGFTWTSLTGASTTFKRVTRQWDQWQLRSDGWWTDGVRWEADPLWAIHYEVASCWSKPEGTWRSLYKVRHLMAAAAKPTEYRAHLATLFIHIQPGSAPAVVAVAPQRRARRRRQAQPSLTPFSDGITRPLGHWEILLKVDELQHYIKATSAATLEEEAQFLPGSSDYASDEPFATKKPSSTSRAPPLQVLQQRSSGLRTRSAATQSNWLCPYWMGLWTYKMSDTSYLYNDIRRVLPRCPPFHLSPSRLLLLRTVMASKNTCPGPDGLSFLLWRSIAPWAVGLIGMGLTALATRVWRDSSVAPRLFPGLQGRPPAAWYVTKIRGKNRLHYRTGLMETDLYLPTKKPCATDTDGTPVFDENGVRPIQVGQTFKRLVVLVAYVLALPAYGAIIGPEHTAWLEWRLGVTNIFEVQHALRKLQSEGCITAVAGLMDLVSAFPRLRRGGGGSHLSSGRVSGTLDYL